MMPSTTMPNRTFPSLGKCIYCLKAFPPEALTDEHIVPEGLNGSLIFKKAVCQTCRTLTSETYEPNLLNKELFVPRRILELRKKKRRKNPWRPLPKAISGLYAIEGSPEFDLSLDAKTYPRFSPITYFVPAGKLSGEDLGSDLKMLRVAFVDMGIAFQKLGGPTTTRQEAVNGPLALTLAKIAYCYAVARLGLDAFDGEDVRDLLLEKRRDVYNFVGGIPVLPPAASDVMPMEIPVPFGASYGLWTAINPISRPTIPLLSVKGAPNIHELHLRKENGFQIVRVHLFASCRSTPPYEVVVGRAR